MADSFAAPGAARVSVVVPMFNAAEFVGEALESIRAQTAPAPEVIVVDDGSTDDSARVAESFANVVLIRKPHSGIGDTVNTGIARATGSILAFLDADDRWRARKTELQLEALRAHPEIDMVFGQALRFQMTPGGEKPVDVLAGITRGGGLFRRAAFERAGGFERSPAEFIDWYARAIEAGLRALTLSEVVYERRIHLGNTVLQDREALTKAYLATLKVSLERRRAAKCGGSGGEGG